METRQAPSHLHTCWLNHIKHIRPPPVSSAGCLLFKIVCDLPVLSLPCHSLLENWCFSVCNTHREGSIILWKWMALNLFLWTGCCGGRAGSHVCDDYVHQDWKVWRPFLPSGLRGGVWQRQGTLWTHQQSLISSWRKEVGIKSLVSVCLQSWRCDPSFVYISLKCQKEVRATSIIVNKFRSSNMLCISDECGLGKCCTKEGSILFEMSCWPWRSEFCSMIESQWSGHWKHLL